MKNQIPDVGLLVTNTAFNTKIGEVEKNYQARYIITTEQ